jgi:hypothetical protein
MSLNYASVVVLAIIATLVLTRASAVCWVATGVAMVVVGVAMMVAGRLVAGSPRVGGASEPHLEDFEGVRLTTAELAAIREVRGRRLPMARLPVNAADVPRLPYRPHAYEYNQRTIKHLGQRKLLLSEVSFLANCTRAGEAPLGLHQAKQYVVVYVGSAPGIHIPYLASLFPALRFVLHDPRPFELREVPLPRGSGTKQSGQPSVLARIEAHVEFFTDEIAKTYAGRDDVLFVSDIRTGTDGPEIPSDATVERDMEMQAEWVRIMNPLAILLKYRLNYTSDRETTYIAGDARLQVWPGGTSTEVRLEARRPYRQAPVSARDHEERMFYVNTVLREWATYDHGVPLNLVRGLDYGFDCASEIRIWSDFLTWRGQAATPAAIAKLMNDASDATHRGIGPLEPRRAERLGMARPAAAKKERRR